MLYNLTQIQIQKLENAQLDAARLVTGGTKLTSARNLYTETKWEKLSNRRHSHKLITFHKMVNGLSPQYLCNLLPARVRDRHTYGTRQANNLTQIITRTAHYSNSFLPLTSNMWNNLSDTIKNCKTISTFKKELLSENGKVPNYYYSGTRLGQILHARLRLNSSSLNYDLFIRNLVDSPNCRCGSIETIKHFLLCCPIYDAQRLEMFNYLVQFPINLRLEVLLYGSTVLNDYENETLFKYVQTFIIKSKRFAPGQS